jgi:teichuronic acid biosynthesis glycosyltransferase TuaG
MEYKELISIVTPTYNSNRFIRNTIKSVCDQTYPFWEMIIIDDGSTDETPEVIKEIANNESRIKWKILDKNRGIASARNEAIKMANGRFLTFLDHDDLWLPQKLEEQVTFMMENNYHFTYTSYERINEDGTLVNRINAPFSITYDKFLKNTIIGCLTVMVDRRFFPIIHLENILSNDLLLWINLLKTEDGYGLQRCLAQYRIVKNSASRNKLKTAKSLWIIYRTYERLKLMYSIYCLTNWAFNAILKRLK